MTGVDVRIVGTDLPGRRWDECEGVHVGVQCKRDVEQLVAGDADGATWDLTVGVLDAADGLDFRGPYVQGKRGERFLYLSWGCVADHGGFAMFRRAKLMLAAVDAAVVRSADRPGHRLVANLGLTDGRGGPRCAAVRPPVITWTAEASDAT